MIIGYDIFFPKIFRKILQEQICHKIAKSVKLWTVEEEDFFLNHIIPTYSKCCAVWDNFHINKMGYS